MAGKPNTENVNPKPKREDFDRVLRSLLNTPPVTREEVEKETGHKRHKKLGKVLPSGTAEK